MFRSSFLGSYEASVSILLVIEFMISDVEAFMITSLVKLVGSTIQSAIICLNSSSCAASGSSPNNKRYAASSNINLLSPAPFTSCVTSYPL